MWLSPFYPSPMQDSGYDVADYCDVDPRFGTLGDFDKLLAAATELGLRVIVDIVPNHCSSDHPLFQAALAAEPGSPERDLFIFRDKPNNWPSFFGGSAWTQVPDGQYYLHLFDSTQPDWNWENPAVPAMFEDILRFWLDRGVAGFRVDVGNALYKAAGLPDVSPEVAAGGILRRATRTRRTRTSPSSTSTTGSGGRCSTPTAPTVSPVSGSWSVRPGRTTPPRSCAGSALA